MEARNLAPLPIDIDHTVAAALPISGLAAWQGLFDHGRLAAGQTVLIHGAAGGVGSIAVQLAREVGARVIGTGRTADRDRAGELGVHTFLDLETEKLEDAGEVDVVFDVIGGDVLARSAALVRAGGTLVTIAEPPKTQPQRRAGSLLPCRSRSRPARRPRRASAGWTPQAGGGCRAATRRSRRRIRSRQAHPWQDDPARSRRAEKRPPMTGRRIRGSAGVRRCSSALVDGTRSAELALRCMARHQAIGSSWATAQAQPAHLLIANRASTSASLKTPQRERQPTDGLEDIIRRTDRCGDARACGPRRPDAGEFGSKAGCPNSFRST